MGAGPRERLRPPAAPRRAGEGVPGRRAEPGTRPGGVPEPGAAPPTGPRGHGPQSKAEARSGSRRMMRSAPMMSKEKPERIIFVIGTVPEP